MKLYQATTTVHPFFEATESHSKDGWMKKLNLDEEQFVMMINRHAFIEIDDEVHVEFFGADRIVVINKSWSKEQLKDAKEKIEKLFKIKSSK